MTTTSLGTCSIHRSREFCFFGNSDGIESKETSLFVSNWYDMTSAQAPPAVLNILQDFFVLYDLTLGHKCTNQTNRNLVPVYSMMARRMPGWTMALISSHNTGKWNPTPLLPQIQIKTLPDRKRDLSLVQHTHLPWKVKMKRPCMSSLVFEDAQAFYDEEWRKKN